MLTGSAFQYKNYKLFFAGQTVSMAGTWVQQVAMAWLTYRISHSVLLLTMATFASQFPVVILGIFAGGFADKWDKKKALISIQYLFMLQSLVLILLIITNILQPWYLIVLSALVGCLNAFESPLRQVFVASLIVDKKILPSAIVSNSLIVNTARIVGPAFAGMILASSSEVVCFIINLLSYAAVIYTYSKIKISETLTSQKNIKEHGRLLDGFRFIMVDDYVRLIVLMMLFLSIFGSTYIVFLTLLVSDLNDGGGALYGMLVAFSGGGCLSAGIFLIVMKNRLQYLNTIRVATPVGGIFLLILSYTTTIAIAYSAIFFIGFFFMLSSVSANTIIQSRVDDKLRGRVMAFYAIALFGGAPIGSVFLGYFIKQFGVRQALIGSAFLEIVATCFVSYFMYSLVKVNKTHSKNVKLNNEVDTASVWLFYK